MKAHEGHSMIGLATLVPIQTVPSPSYLEEIGTPIFAEGSQDKETFSESCSLLPLLWTLESSSQELVMVIVCL